MTQPGQRGRMLGIARQKPRGCAIPIP